MPSLPAGAAPPTGETEGAATHVAARLGDDRDPASPWDRWGRGLIGAFTIALIAATWNLWWGGTDYPAIPWLSFARPIPLGVDRALLIVLLVVSGCLTLSAVYGGGVLRGRLRPRLLGAALLAWSGLLVLDQHRLQPWAWLFWLETLALWGLPSREARGWTRGLVISLYVWSAVSKLDVSFLAGRGPWLLTGLFEGLGLSTALIPPERLARLTLLLPAGELLAAGCLAFRPTRGLGQGLAIAMHLALLVALGPWGHDHHLGVLLWNLYFLCQIPLLFRDAPGPAATELQASGEPKGLVWGTRGILAAAIVAPALSSWGLYDHWPAWEVYSDRPEIVRAWVPETAIGSLPSGIRRSPPLPLSDQCEIHLDDWSFANRRCPLYPQARYRLALLRSLVEQGFLKEGVRVTIEGPPDRRTGARIAAELDGVPALTRACDDFWANTRPSVR